MSTRGKMDVGMERTSVHSVSNFWGLLITFGVFVHLGKRRELV